MKSNKYIFIFGTAALIPTFIWILSFFSSYVNSLINNSNFYALILNLFSLLNIIIVALISLLYYEHNNILNSFKSILNKKVDAYELSYQDLYRKLNTQLVNVQNSVWVMSLRNTPPKKSIDKDSIIFFNQIYKIAKNNNKIKIRIILKQTNNTKEWIESLVEKYDNIHNISIASIVDSNNINSIQIFDNNHIIIIGINDNNYRNNDLYIKSEVIAKSYENYYNKIWNKSNILLQNGIKK